MSRQLGNYFVAKAKNSRSTHSPRTWWALARAQISRALENVGNFFRARKTPLFRPKHKKKDYLMTIFPAPTAMKWNAENFPSPFIPLLGLEESHFMDDNRALGEIWGMAEDYSGQYASGKLAAWKMSMLSAGGWTQNVLRRVITEAGGWRKVIN